jgi:hypothetical protein
MPIVAVPAIIRAAVIGVRPSSVIGWGVVVAVISIARSISISIARPISIRPVGLGREGPCGQCAGREAEP